MPVKPVKGVDYLTDADIKELGNHFAPAGYGLGKKRTDTITDASVVATLFENGWYEYYNNSTPLIPNIILSAYGAIRVDTGGAATRQTFYPRANPTCSLVRTATDFGAWGEWEWENPPMIPGIEYRTTERWNGKPVYTTLVDCGTLTGASDNVDVLTTHPAHHIIRHCGHVGTYGLPMINGTLDNEYSAWANVTDSNGYLKVNIHYGTGMVGNTGMVRAWYTKYEGGI